MRDNLVQFAVVREDPLLPMHVLSNVCCERSRILLIASGGCTALAVASEFVKTEITLIDKNPAQLDLVRKKIEACKIQSVKEFKTRFNVSVDWADGLNECGNFESLFRGFRSFIHDFVFSYEELKKLFDVSKIDQIVKSKILSSKYWPVAFDLYFSDSLLNTMFGPDATQHAEKGSYPRYFQTCFEKALTRSDASVNYFLHHIFLGHYLDRPDCLPPYLQKLPNSVKMSLMLGGLDDIPEKLGEYDFIDLSNIFDWMGDDSVNKIADLLDEKMKPNAVLMFRQLNNNRNIQSRFSRISFDDEIGLKLLSQDRSFFYCKINVGRKI